MAADPKLDLEVVEELVRLAQTRSLSELTLNQDGIEVSVLREGTTQGAVVSIPAAQSTPPVLALPAAARPSAGPDTSGLTAVESPMIGVFFRSPGPDHPAFVEVGDHVQPGQTVGLIEAMKVFSEIFAETAGTVVQISAKNADLVQTGQILMYIRPDAA